MAYVTTQLREKGKEIIDKAREGKQSSIKYPQLIYKCFDENTLNSLDRLKSSWQAIDDGGSTAKLVWLALTAILRRSSSAGTVQWQYILPNKTKKSTTEPFVAFANQIALMGVDMAKVWRELRRICREGATACFVVGDSAPYVVYVPIDQWLGRLAVAAGFKCFHFEKLRDRNVKWKNRKHRVPLHEGRLWVSG